MKQIYDVSIVIPAYNAQHFVIPALESIVNQSCHAKEVLIVDDGSADATVEIVEEWIARTALPFPVKLFKQKNSGSSAARNSGISKATGRWVALMDVDDIWETCHLAELLAAAALCPDAIAAYGAGKLLVGDTLGEEQYDNFWDNPSLRFGKRIADSDYLKIDVSVFPRLVKGNFIKPSSLMFDRVIALKSGLFDVTLRTGEDREFLVRLIFNGPFVYTPRSITQYRWHDDNLSQVKNAKRNLENGLRVIDKIIKNRKLALDEAQLQACKVEIKAAATEYLYVCAKSGFANYLRGLAVIRQLFGMWRAVLSFNIKHLVHAILPKERTTVPTGPR